MTELEQAREIIRDLLARLMADRLFGWVDGGSAAALGRRSDTVRRLMDGGRGVIRTTWDSEPP